MTLKREIIFRGKTVIGNKWIYGLLCYNADDDYCIQTSDDTVEVVPESIGQYTGLNTKLGIRIFEDDIVNGAEFNGSYAYGKIVYLNYEFVIWPIGKFLEGLADLGYNAKHLEVIGNVHDNPELVKN